MERGHEGREAAERDEEMRKGLGTFDRLKGAIERSTTGRFLAGLAILTTLEACGQFSEEMAAKTRVAGVGFEVRAEPDVSEARHGRLGGSIEIVGTTDGSGK